MDLHQWHIYDIKQILNLCLDVVYFQLDKQVRQYFAIDLDQYFEIYF